MVPRATGRKSTAKKAKAKSGSKQRARKPRAKKFADESDISLPAVGTLGRTRRLLLAALRLWELKRGLRD